MIESFLRYLDQRDHEMTFACYETSYLRSRMRSVLTFSGAPLVAKRGLGVVLSERNDVPTQVLRSEAFFGTHILAEDMDPGQCPISGNPMQLRRGGVLNLTTATSDYYRGTIDDQDVLIEKGRRIVVFSPS